MFKYLTYTTYLNIKSPNFLRSCAVKYVEHAQNNPTVIKYLFSWGLKYITFKPFNNHTKNPNFLLYSLI